MQQTLLNALRMKTLPAARLFLHLMSAVMMRTATHMNTSTLMIIDRAEDPNSDFSRSSSVVKNKKISQKTNVYTFEI